MPNALDLLFVQVTLDISFVAITLSGLSFVGAGARPPSAEWGAMIYEGTQVISTSWWVAMFPGIALTLTAVSFSPDRRPAAQRARPPSPIPHAAAVTDD